MIRLANSNDLDKINKLGLLINPNFLATYNVSSYIEDDKYIVLVDDEVHSFLIMLKTIDNYELEMIVVDPYYRRSGIASNLFDYFLKKYAKIGDIIFLEVNVNNDAALGFYKKIGFEIINTRKGYYNGIDALVMKKVI